MELDLSNKTVGSDDESDDEEQYFLSSPVQMDAMQFVMKELRLRQINSEWLDLDDTKRLCKIRFKPKVRRIWLPAEDEADAFDSNVLVMDEVELNLFGKEGPFDDVVEFELESSSSVSKSIDCAEKSFGNDEMSMIPNSCPNNLIETTDPVLSNTFILEPSEISQVDHASLAKSVFTFEFLTALQTLPELQSFVKQKLLENAVPQSLIEDLFSVKFTKLVFDEKHEPEPVTVNAKTEGVQGPVKEIEHRSPSIKKSKEIAHKTVAETVSEANVSEEKSPRYILRQNLSGSGDISPYYTRSKVKPSAFTPSLKDGSKMVKTSTPLSDSKKGKSRQAERPGFEEPKGATRFLIDTDWLQRKIEPKHVNSQLPIATSPGSSARSNAGSTPSTSKKKVMYNYAGRHFYPSEERAGISGRSKVEGSTKFETSTPKVKRGQSTVSRNLSITSLK